MSLGAGGISTVWYRTDQSGFPLPFICWHATRPLLHLKTISQHLSRRMKYIYSKCKSAPEKPLESFTSCLTASSMTHALHTSVWFLCCEIGLSQGRVKWKLDEIQVNSLIMKVKWLQERADTNYRTPQHLRVWNYFLEFEIKHWEDTQTPYWQTRCGILTQCDIYSCNNKFTQSTLNKVFGLFSPHLLTSKHPFLHRIEQFTYVQLSRKWHDGCIMGNVGRSCSVCETWLCANIQLKWT